MRSLIILEVEHGEDTDTLTRAVEWAADEVAAFDGIELANYTVRVDLPACFVLDSTHTD